MKYKIAITKKDMLVTVGCVVFVLLNLAAIGNSGKQKAKEIICLSNMGQWNQIINAYANDHMGFLPPDYYYNNGMMTRCQWYEAMEDYYVDKNMLLCPCATKTNAEGGVDPFKVYSMSGYDMSYCFNGWMGRVENASMAAALGRTAEWRWQNMNALVNPSTVPMMGDSIGYTRKFPHASTEPTAYRNCDISKLGLSHTARLIEYCITRHGPMDDPYINSAFGDGSVRNVGLKELWVLNWHRDWQKERADYQPTINWPDWMEGFTDYE